LLLSGQLLIPLKTDKNVRLKGKKLSIGDNKCPSVYLNIINLCKTPKWIKVVDFPREKGQDKFSLEAFFSILKPTSQKASACIILNLFTFQNITIYLATAATVSTS
jgi:hypothetical protein